MLFTQIYVIAREVSSLILLSLIANIKQYKRFKLKKEEDYFGKSDKGGTIEKTYSH